MPLKPSSRRPSLTKAELLSELDSASQHIAGLEAELASLRESAPAGAAAKTAPTPAGDDSTPSDNRFRQLIEGSLQAIYVRQDNLTVFANRAFAEMFGFDSPGELIGKDNLKLVAPQDRARIEKYRHDRLRGLYAPPRYQFKALRKDGSTLWIEGFWQLIEWKGKPAILATLIDITAQKQAEEQLRDHASQLRQVFDAIPHTMALKDNEGRYLLVNKQWSELTGCAPEDAIGKTVAEFEGLSQDEVANVVRTDAEALAKDEPISWFQNSLADKTGSLRSYHTAKAPIRNSQGETTGLVVVGLDVTEQLKSEAQLRESEGRLQQVFDAIPHTMTLIDNAGRYVLVNKAWFDFWNYTGDDPLGKKVNELVGRSTEDIASIQSADREALGESGGSARWFDQTLFGSGEEPRRFRTVKTPLRDSGGDITGLVSVGLDVTEQVRAANNLRESEARLRAFMDSAGDVFNIFDENLNLVEMSLSSLKKWGGSREEKIGKHITELFPGSGVAGRLERYQEVVETGQPIEFDAYLDTPLMGRLYVRRKAFPVGKGLGIIVTDLTDLHRAQQETEESAGRFRAIAEATPYAMFIVRKSDGQWRYANAMATEMFGVGDEISNISAMDTYWNPSERQEFLDLMERDGKVAGMERRCKRANGEMFWARISSAPLRFEGEDAFLTSLIDITEQKTAQEELAANRRLLQTIFDSIPLSVFVKDRQRRYVMVNRHHAETNALDREALIGKLAEEIPQWAEAEKAAAIIEDKDVLERGMTINIPERRIERPDGSIVWHRISRVPIYDDEGNITGLVGIRSDITDLKQAAEQLQTSERLLQTIFDALPISVLVKDASLRYVMVNQASAERHGLDPADFVGRSTEQVIPITDEAAKATQEQDQWVLDHGKMLEIPESHEHFTDKADQWNRVIRTPLKDEQGRVIGLVAIRENITERKQAAEELQESKALLQTIFDTLPVGIFVKDTEGRFLMVNRAFCGPSNLNPEDCHGKISEEVWEQNEEESTRRRTEDRYVMETNARLEIPAVPVTFKDSTRWYYIVKSPLHDHAGNVVGIVGSRMDITERLRIEDQLRQMEKMEAVGKLAGGVAHEFNNILHMILGFTELMLSKTPPGDPHHRNLSTIKSASEKGASLVRQLLGYSRKQILQPRLVDVSDLLNSTAHIMMATLGSQVMFQVAPAAGLPRVYADPDSIEQILLNLCLNARDAMPEGGRMIVECKGVVLDEAFCAEHSWAKPGGYVSISVTDTGGGIPEDVLPRIFDPFFTTKGPQDGSGLGLSMVHGLMEQQNGCLNVNSELGRGTTFELYFPVAMEDAAIALELPEKPAGPAPEPHPPPAARGLILAVEDEAGIQQLTEQVLTTQGYRLLQAYDGEEGLRLFEQHAEDIDLLLLDVILPGMDGKELHERITALKPEIPVVFHSGYHLDNQYTNYLAEKELPLLRKPYTSAELMKAVQAALGKAEKT